MNFVSVGYDQIDSVVDKSYNLFWNGWTIIEWRRDPEGFFSKNGIFKDGKWGVIKRKISLDSDGTWKVPVRYVAN